VHDQVTQLESFVEKFCEMEHARALQVRQECELRVQKEKELSESLCR
jgi:hypothetical protein